MYEHLIESLCNADLSTVSICTTRGEVTISDLLAMRALEEQERAD